jgi:hypothetical protein
MTKLRLLNEYVQRQRTELSPESLLALCRKRLVIRACIITDLAMAMYGQPRENTPAAQYLTTASSNFSMKNMQGLTITLMAIIRLPSPNGGEEYLATMKVESEFETGNTYPRGMSGYHMDSFCVSDGRALAQCEEIITEWSEENPLALQSKEAVVTVGALSAPLAPAYGELQLEYPVKSGLMMLNYGLIFQSLARQTDSLSKGLADRFAGFILDTRMETGDVLSLT